MAKEEEEKKEAMPTLEDDKQGSAPDATDPMLRTPPRGPNGNIIVSAMKGGHERVRSVTNTINSLGSSSSNNSRRLRHLSSTTSSSIGLHDILSSGGPQEMEAETQILRAVEKITGQAHMRPTDPETAQLYSAIAAKDREAQAIQRQEELGIESEDDIFPSTNTPTPTASNMAPPVTAAPTAPPPDTSADATKSKARSKFKSLVRQSIAMNKENGNNVEETLFGLSSALSQMDQEGDYNKRHSNREVGSFDTTFTSADKLANLTVGGVLSKTVENDFEDEDELSILADSTVGGGDLEEGGGTRNGNATTTATSNNNKSPPESSDTDESNSGDFTKSGRKKDKRKRSSVIHTAKGGIREEFELFNEFLGGKKRQTRHYARTVLLFIMLPGLLLAGLLFYFVEEFDTDPETGLVVPGQDASISWWILFLTCRQLVTLTMALITQALVVDFLALGSRYSILRYFGPIPTLLIVQSKGWPFISTFWGTYNLILLSGDSRYARHWLYFQDFIELFNEENPGGNVINSSTNYAIMRLMIIVGVCVSIKRLVVGLFLGRQTFAHYGKELATVMKNMVLVGKVATLAREIEKDRDLYEQESVADDVRARSNTLTDFLSGEADAALEAEEEDAKNNKAAPSAADAATAFMARRQRANSGVSTRSRLQSKSELSMDASSTAPAPDEAFTESEQVQIGELLDAWEEPVRAQDTEERKITIGAVMQFRQALTYMKRKYPFLPAFGPADSRERCIASAQAVYERLMIRTPHSDVLPFETLALLAKNGTGGIDPDRAKELIKIFRPERDGSLGKLEFIKSIDQIYKQLRLLSANISNSSQIDKAIESIINIAFYIFLGCIVLTTFGEDPRALFLSFSSVALGFAFLFSASAAKYFEGVLFILVQRPYGVGDRVHLSDPQNETNPDGSSCWIVEKVGLTTTTVFWGTTNERATLSNGAIANLRVINAARSPNATVFVVLKFGIDTPYEKIAIFRSAVEQFLKDRPREWLTFIGFRPTEVVVDQAYIGYKIIAQHRNHWQGIGGILESKSSLTTYCLEVAKKLEMRYHAPPLPVDLSIGGSASSALEALQGNSRRGGLDKRKLDDVLRANSPAIARRTHAAFAAESGDE